MIEMVSWRKCFPVRKQNKKWRVIDMGKDVAFTVDGKDLADVMELIEKRVAKHNGTPAEAAYLALAVAECILLVLKKNWVYEQDFENEISAMRREAKLGAIKVSRDSGIL